MTQVHRFKAACSWSGSTGAGYEQYDRSHVGSVPGISKNMELSSAPAFGGEVTKLNPEQLLVLAAVSCQLLSFLAVAARARIEVLGYEDEGEGEMDEAVRPVRIMKITLRPTIKVRVGVSVERIRHLVEVAHRECFIASSLLSEIEVQPTVIFV